jgi:hypothetical protein
MMSPGFCRPEAMRSAYKGAHVVLNTSYSTGLSNTLTEAIAAGCPVLASDIQGNRWPVLGENGDSPSGYLFDPHDPGDFIRKALRLIDDKKGRAEFSRASRKRAENWPTPGPEADGLIFACKMIPPSYPPGENCPQLQKKRIFPADRQCPARLEREKKSP